MRLRLRKPSACRDERGLTLVEVVAALAIAVLAYSSVHLTVGTAVMGRLMTSSMVSKQQQGRLVVEWIADRVRQAGYNTPSSGGCQNKIVTAGLHDISISADVGDGNGPARHRFYIKPGVSTIYEQVSNCIGATLSDQPLTSSTSVQATDLTFKYYNASGNPEITPANIRFVTVSATVLATAGARGPSTQTWTTSIDFRNP
jgi:Tfp pilus assembly protein PilW